MDEHNKRSYIIGKDWLYYKIYTGPQTSDAFLLEAIDRVTDHLIKKKVIIKWFFIRYLDPKYHLRVRFNYRQPNHVSDIINSLYPYLEKYQQQGLIWKVQIDTYNREIERYGKRTIQLAEDYFFYDSEMIIDFLKLFENEDDLRWIFSLVVIDSSLNCFDYNAEEKLLLLERLKTGFGEEFGMGRPLKKQLDAKYRLEREKIEEFMTFGNKKSSAFSHIINKNKKNIKKIADKILILRNSGELNNELDELMSSYIHMFMNRLFRSKNRLHEMVCYDFLFRYYQSNIAREKYEKIKKIRNPVFDSAANKEFSATGTGESANI